MADSSGYTTHYDNYLYCLNCCLPKITRRMPSNRVPIQVRGQRVGSHPLQQNIPVSNDLKNCVKPNASSNQNLNPTQQKTSPKSEQIVKSSETNAQSNEVKPNESPNHNLHPTQPQTGPTVGKSWQINQIKGF